MSKFFRIVISSALLGILMLLSLTAFNIGPSQAAPAPPVSGGEIILHNNDNSILAKGEGFEETLYPITAQGANFVVNYSPATGCKTSGLVDFLPPQVPPDPWSNEAKAAFEHALSIWSMVLDANQTIVINACWVDPGSTTVLGTGQPVSAFADFTPTPAFTNTLYVAALANELAGTDLNDNDGPDHDGDGNDADAEIIIAFNGNAGINWYFGTDSNPGGQEDFVTAALHEIAHGLGFVSTMNVDDGIIDLPSGNPAECGTNVAGDGCWGVGFPDGFPAVYDRFLEDTANGSGDKLTDGAAYTNPSSELGDQLTTGSVFFDGPNAVIGGGGSRPVLYTPNTFEVGSSILHLNQSTYQNTFNRLMVPTAGNPQHHPAPITLGILEDIGWNIIDLPLATLTKSASTTLVGGEQVISYTLTVQNTGHLLMTDVLITDTVPASTTLNTDSLNSGDVTASGTTPGSLVTWTTNLDLSTINTLSRTFAVTVSVGSGSTATITNTGFVTSSAGVGANDMVSTTVGGSNVYLPIILLN